MCKYHLGKHCSFVQTRKNRSLMRFSPTVTGHCFSSCLTGFSDRGLVCHLRPLLLRAQTPENPIPWSRNPGSRPTPVTPTPWSRNVPYSCHHALHSSCDCLYL